MIERKFLVNSKWITFTEFENNEEFNLWEYHIFQNFANKYNKNVLPYKNDCFLCQELSLKQKCKLSCIENYCGCGYASINRYLLGMEKGSSDTRRLIQEPDECFDTAPKIDRNVICFRVTGEKEKWSYNHNHIIPKFLSVTALKGVCKEKFNGSNKNTIMLLIPKGTPVICPNLICPLYEPRHTIERYEAELVLPRRMIIQKSIINTMKYCHGCYKLNYQENCQGE